MGKRYFGGFGGFGVGCIGLVLGGLAACDPKAGFESAAGAIDPADKSYLDGPGSRLVSGPYDRVGVDLYG